MEEFPLEPYLWQSDPSVPPNWQRPFLPLFPTGSETPPHCRLQLRALIPSSFGIFYQGSLLKLAEVTVVQNK